MQIFSNHLDKPYDVTITLDRNKKRPWRFESSSCKANFHTAGQLLSFLLDREILTSEMCKAVLHNTVYPAAWVSYADLDETLTDGIVRGSTVMLIEPFPKPLTPGYFIYILDSDGYARMIEIFLDNHINDASNDYDRPPIVFRVSSSLE